MKLKSLYIAAASIGLLSGQVFAEEVRLFSPDGQVELFGELLETRNDIFVIKTAVGAMTVERSRVICEGNDCPAREIAEADIVARGSDTVGEELFPLLIEGFASQHRAAVSDRAEVAADTTQLVLREDRGVGEQMMIVEVEAAGSSTGFKALLEGSADIGMSSRPPKSRELRDFEAKGLGNLEDIDQEYIVAVDSILMIVSPDNPVTELSVEQASQLFSGRIRNWSELGGPDIAVNVYTRPETSGTRAVFEGAILPNGKITNSAVVISSNAELSEMVSKDPGGIGYVGFADQRNSKPVNITLSCGIATKATPFSAKTEEYVLQRRLRLYVNNADRDARIQEFLDYAISGKADDLVQQAGFIDLGVIADKNGLDTDALLRSTLASSETISTSTMRNMIKELDGAERLSTTFRFASGSSRLDNKAQRDTDRMIQFLAQPENANKEILVVGFTDSDGAFSSNEVLSRSRAQAVVDAIRRHPSRSAISGRNLTALGFGELAPVGCNEDFQGRQRNRRVEIWLR